MGTHMESQDQTQILVRNAQKGARAAFEELAARHRLRLEALIRSRMGPALREAVEVDDLLQETLLRAFQSIGRFRWQGDGSFFRWLAGIAVRVVLQAARRQRRPAPVSSDAGEGVAAAQASPSRTLRRAERFDRLEEALAKLRPEHRDVILLARIENVPLREIARRWNRSPNAIAQLLLRALRSLRDAFGDTESLHLPPRTLDGDGAGSHGG
ncbi:MAG: sigma-70 family RNA polymerase sigma factor [Planctomycetes bacterium]|nr:sigma-70 family RNA polymerase sigma factor [Planctomycetota bacterium]